MLTDREVRDVLFVLRLDDLIPAISPHEERNEVVRIWLSSGNALHLLGEPKMLHELGLHLMLANIHSRCVGIMKLLAVEWRPASHSLRDTWSAESEHLILHWAARSISDVEAVGPVTEAVT